MESGVGRGECCVGNGECMVYGEERNGEWCRERRGMESGVGSCVGNGEENGV